jgi:RHH-type proline utilization regulon transcriptional repressor/proline dehydrogenase/delta 1-pyrroline-5-carboxylate dehydrogenase
MASTSKPFDRITDHAAARAAISRAWLADETAIVEELLSAASTPEPVSKAIAARAADLVAAVRARHGDAGIAQAFLREYSLSSQEGVVLMCLAEALLRIPDAATADKFIEDKMRTGDWEAHSGHSGSLLVNASTWALMLTGGLLDWAQQRAPSIGDTLKALAARSGEPMIRAALRQAMRILAEQFVMGRDIGEALRRGTSPAHAAYCHSFDMLGEAALSTADAERYLAAYRNAIDAIGASVDRNRPLHERSSLSVKLSALHPRYDVAHRACVVAELVPRLGGLVNAARDAGIALTIDAEEAERLELSLDVFVAVYSEESLRGYDGFGLAVQAYQKRAMPVIRWLIALAGAHGRRIPVRLVKGAYWDTEIKRAQERGLAGYPVFTRKSATDVSYVACARLMLEAGNAIYPQFATHNARTVAAIIELAGGREFEFQRLHGMGEVLHDSVRAREPTRCRVYAPVGSHEDLLPYLVRRLLENGANTSFVNRVEDEAIPVEDLIADPVARLQGAACKPHPRIPVPSDIYLPERRNSDGFNLHDGQMLAELDARITRAATESASAVPVIDGVEASGTTRGIRNPADQREVVGTVVEATVNFAMSALNAAHAAVAEWSAWPVEERARCVERFGDLLEARHAALLDLLIREAGKTLADACAELREAVDYCRYYAAHARLDFCPAVLPGPTGERNELALHGRGVFVCISPWNFPLAIFAGQIVAALLAGNTVIAKPARQTPLIAMRAIRLMHEAGIPHSALHFLPGSGAEIGSALLGDARVAGVAFTGSTETAWSINRTLAGRRGPIAPLIAETGGLNVMLADSSALPEQLVVDTLQSAFNSAGQRCSALRVLLVQEEIATRVVRLLSEAMTELVIGDPRDIATDVGPVIDAAAQRALEQHAQSLRQSAREWRRMTPPHGAGHGTYFAPCVYELNSIEQLDREVFGPILHIVRFGGNRLDAIIDAINRSRYGLTLGVHSRIEETVRHVAARARVGNMYVNRNMIGAVVGVQPFGGEGLSGTGPKAGGPYYLHRFATERTRTTNTAAVGGNTALASLGDE